MQKKVESKMKINIDKVADYLMNIGIILCIFNLYLIYDAKNALPPGVCPINYNTGWLLLSIGISVLGLILPLLNKFKLNR